MVPLKAKTPKTSKKKIQKTFIHVLVPHYVEVENGVIEQFFSALHNLQETHGLLKKGSTVSFEIIARENGIDFYFVVPNEHVFYVERQIYSAYPEAKITSERPWNFKADGIEFQTSTVKIKGKKGYPLKHFDDLKGDSLNNLLSPLSRIKENEFAAIQVLFKSRSNRWARSIKTRLNTSDEKRMMKDDTLKSLLQDKIKFYGFDVVIRIITGAPNQDVSTSLAKNIVASFGQFAHPAYTNFTEKNPLSKGLFKKHFWRRSFMPFFLEPRFILNTKELATISHLPNKNVSVSNVNWLNAKTSAPPSEVPKEGIYVGYSLHRAKKQKIYQPDDDRRRHMYIIGQTGVGKSELMKYLAYQDILAGKGVAFVDPHGSAVEDLLLSIPKERAMDVIYFNAGDMDYPVGLNILDCKTEEQRHFVINSFIELLYKLYDPNRTGIMGPILERTIRNVMLTAMAEEGNTMVEVLRLLTDEKFMKSKLPFVEDPLVKRYWTDQMTMTTAKTKGEQVGYFTAKFDRFVTEKLMRNIVGQSHSAFDLREVMDNKKILLINLSKGAVGEENSKFLGLLLVPRILMAALSRSTEANRDYPDFYLYVDEFQNFATPTFTTILSEVRKYKLNLIVGNQYIGQLLDEVKDAVFGNIGTLISFRVGIDDATYMEKYFDPAFNVQDLTNAAIGNAVCRMLLNGEPTAPFSLVGDWDAMQQVPKNHELAQTIVDISRVKYGRNKHDVEYEIEVRGQLS